MISMKQEIEDWVAAAHLYDNNNFEEAILGFQPIADNSKILFNCGVIRATLGDHAEAVQYFQRATSLDSYLAIAYFQQGVSNFLMGDFEEALSNFNETLGCLRGNRSIDYEQLGLKHKLYSCEVLFNRGLCYVYLQQPEIGLTDIAFAAKEKANKDHDVIDDAIREKAEGYTVFSIPVGVIYRPSEAKVRNVRKQDYLGKARLVRQASQDASLHRRKMSSDAWALDDRPADQLSYGATNLYRPNLAVRSRQQSEPPVHRNMFPPTPPPEAEKSTYFQHQPGQSSPPRTEQYHAERPRRDQSLPAGNRSRSTERRAAPARLDLGAAAFGKNTPSHRSTTDPNPHRQYPPRSQSERPIERREQPESRHSSADDRQRREHLFGAVDNSPPRQVQRSRTAPSEPAQPDLLSPASSHASERSPRQMSHTSTQPQRSQRRVVSRQSAASNPNRIEEEDEAPVPEVVDDGPRARAHGYSTPSSYGTHASVSSTATLSPNNIPQKTGPALRVKVHVEDDTRYVLLPSLHTCTLLDLQTQLARKFSLKLSELESGRVKIKARDEEGDFVTVGDAEDWAMVLGMARASVPSAPTADAASKEVVKIEVWVVA